MFWRFGGYANVSTIDTILEKPDFTLEDLLDESDLIQELKQHNAKLVEYLREPKVLKQLLDYVVAPKLEPVATPDNEEEEDDTKGKGLSLPFSRPRASSRATDGGDEKEEAEKKRNRYAFVAAEVLSSDTWSIYGALMESRDMLRQFWTFLKRPVPLDPLQASYFTKVNESLFDKKTEEMLELLKSIENAVPDMLRHVDCPMIMDLLLKIISLERTESGQGIVEWLFTQDVMPTLLSFLGPEHSWATQTSAGDFMKAIITVSANASQNEQTCIGPNELTRQLVSKPCVEQLIKYMLGGGNPLTVGVGIVIEVIRKNNSDYDPDMGQEPNQIPSSRDPIYLGTLLRLFAEHVPDFMNLIMTAPAQKDRFASTFGDKIEPLGFDRFKTCELMAELLHCSNMGLLNEVGAEAVISKRDEERQRLRAEGTLTIVRAEEPPSSAEDLTMRIPQRDLSTEEGRRLEVTNASGDDDFEEVTHSGELSEDAANDFVKAEEDLPEIPDVPTSLPSSFLDKDDDDFVDEPLSSPRLNVREPEIAEEDSGLEDPELAVAPLSPTKPKPEDSIGEAPAKDDSKLDEASEKVEDLSLEDAVPEKGEPEADVEAEEAQAIKSAPDAPEPASLETPAEDAAKEEADAPSVDEEKPDMVIDVPAVPEPPVSAAAAPLDTLVNPSKLRDFSPHPEDTPAPLFSAPAPPAPAPPPREEASGVSEGQVSPVVGDFLKTQFVEHQVVPTILSFFFKYPWNNFLHNVVYDIVQQVFNGPMDRGYNPTLAISLFEAADVTTQIINGQAASEESQTQNKTRMGYMGHLTLIAEEVVKFTERHPPELLSETVLDRVMAQDWVNYVEGALAETRERDNAILGGVRPEVAMSNRAAAGGLSGLSGLGALGLGGGGQGGSSALADAGLNGGLEQSEGGGGGIGPFAISSGTLMSGFGSSSDEEDDEESEEDVNNEFRAYTDPLNANNNSMNPPSIPPPPPPPPPLNIPPSRARLQLAARLAMNKRNAAAAAAAANGSSEPGDATGEEGSASFNILKSLQAPPELSVGDHRLRNPFADDEDDEVDEEEERRSGSGSGSDDDDERAARQLRDAGGVGSNSWNRGSWWRGVVRGSRKGGKKRAGESSGRTTERFGDGRDDSEDSEGGDEEEEDEVEDEEFGDFAMPEGGEGAGGREGNVSGIDPAREKVLLKPLPVHPSSSRTTASPFGSLWPFSTQGFGSKDKEKEKADADKPGDAETQDNRAASGGEKDRFEEEDEDLVGDDGKPLSRVTEAKRRTSIEDPDEDEVDVGEEIIVGRPAGVGFS